MEQVVSEPIAAGILFYDGIVRYPEVKGHGQRGAFFHEVIITRDGLQKVPLYELVKLRGEKMESMSIEFCRDDGSVLVRGLPREAYTPERAEYEAIEVANLFQERFGLSLDIVEISSLRCYARC